MTRVVCVVCLRNPATRTIAWGTGATVGAEPLCSECEPGKPCAAFPRAPVPPGKVRRAPVYTSHPLAPPAPRRRPRP